MKKECIPIEYREMLPAKMRTINKNPFISVVPSNFALNKDPFGHEKLRRRDFLEYST